MATKNYCYRCRSIFFAHPKRCWWCGWRICKHCKACGCQYRVAVAGKQETFPQFRKQVKPRIVRYRLHDSHRTVQQIPTRAEPQLSVSPADRKYHSSLSCLAVEAQNTFQKTSFLVLENYCMSHSTMTFIWPSFIGRIAKE